MRGYLIYLIPSLLLAYAIGQSRGVKSNLCPVKKQSDNGGVSESSPSNEEKDPPLPPIRQCTGMEKLQGSDVYAFDQKLIENIHIGVVAYNTLRLSEKFWKRALDRLEIEEVDIKQQPQACYFYADKVVRTTFSLQHVSFNYSQLISTFLKSHSKSEMPGCDGPPMPFHGNCLNLSIANTCGKNAHCLTVYNKSDCRCYNGYSGEPSVKCTAYCEKEKICEYNFDQTYAGVIAGSQAKCPQGFPVASVTCEENSGEGNGASFNIASFTTVNCDVDIENIIDLALNSSDSTNSFDDYVSYLQVVSYNSSNFNKTDVNDITQFFEKVSNLADSDELEISTATSLRPLASIAAQLVDGYWNSSDGEDRETLDDPTQANKLRRSIVTSLPKISLRATFSQNESEFSMDNPAFSLQSYQYNMTNISSINYSPLVRQSDGEKFMRPVDLYIPANTVQKAWNLSRNRKNSTNQKSVFILYKNDALFASKENVSQVLSVNIGVNATLKNLDNPIVIRFRETEAKHGTESINGTSFKVNKTTVRCVFWDTETSTWSTEGCCLNTSSEHPECQCNHLTNFAIIVNSEIVQGDFVLSTVSMVGCVLSIVCLIITIAVLSANKDLRKYRSGKILLHLCCNLCIAYFIFVTGTSTAVGNYVGCIIVTALLHYFFLTTWCWMAVYAYEMYKSIIKVFITYGSNFMMKSSAFSYIIPAIIVSLTAAISISLQEKPSALTCEPDIDMINSPYHAENVCWLKGYPLYFGFLLPIGLLLFHNLVVFILVSVELAKQNHKSQHLKRSTKDSLLIGTTTTVIMGLTWIVGYFLLVSTHDAVYLVFSWIFAILNTLQGLEIFLLTTLRREDMRKVWWYPIRRAIFGRKSGLLEVNASQSYTNVKTSTTYESHSKYTVTTS